MNLMGHARLVAYAATAIAGCILLAYSIAPSSQLQRKNPPTVRLTTVGSRINLLSQKGDAVDFSRLAGKPFLVLFGSTRCADACPVALSDVSALLRELGTTADRFNVLFVTVDPAWDTRERLSSYMGAFDNRILALRGSQAETDSLIRIFAGFAGTETHSGGRDVADHTNDVYVMNADGHVATVMDMRNSHKSRLKTLRHIAGPDVI